MSKTKLSLLDLAFFVAESDASPKHVAGLLIFKRPARSSINFARELYEEYLTKTDVKAPFNRLIKFSLTGMPYWRECKVDVNEHIFYHKMPKGENTREHLYKMVSAMHEPKLDRSKPLWEVHIIDGLENGRFALYQKMHHACADGVTMMRWTCENMTDDPSNMDLDPIWTTSHSGKRHRDDANTIGLKMLANLWSNIGSLSKQALGIARLGTMMFLESVRLTKNAISLPFVAVGDTPLTGQVTSGRQFATVTVGMDRINRIRNVTRSTLNHVALTCLDGALHRYLEDQGIQLQRPINIQMPVNLRKDGETQAGNKIGIIQVELSPKTDDPYVRLRNIGFSLRNVRSMIDSVVPEAIESYTLIVGLFGQITEMLHLSNQLPPMGNTLVSNVPGPQQHMYLKGAKMEEMHPMSTLPPSNLLNITLFSYAGELTFGLIATDELPNLERLATFVQEAFDELEQSVQAIPLLLPPAAPAKAAAKAVVAAA